MKAIIIEDEELSAKHLALLLGKIDPDIEVIATFDSVKKSAAAFNGGLTADLLFLDIHLADGLSFEIFTKTELNIPVIFTTAFDEYAIKAFKVNSIDYLLKPIGINDLRASLEKYKRQQIKQNQNMAESIATIYQNMNKQYKNRFMVKQGDNIASIKTDEISNFISEEGMVLLVTLTGKRYIIDYTLDQLETLLAPDAFFRINRKVIIHINSIKKVSSYFNSRLKLNSEHLPENDAVVSRERVNDFKLWLDQ